MVLSAVVQEKSSGIQRIAMCSIGTIGIVIAIATSCQANTLQTANPDAIIIEPLESQWEYTESQSTESQSTESQSTELQHSAETEAEAAADRAGLERLRARLLSPRTTPEAAVPPAHGTYLYGQQPIADQPETAYFVFESQGRNVTGALYMPSSSFDCVQGQIIDQRIALSVRDSYSQETYSYALNLNEPLVEVASQNSAIAPPPNIDGFYPLPLREQDRAILATCQAI